MKSKKGIWFLLVGLILLALLVFFGIRLASQKHLLPASTDTLMIEAPEDTALTSIVLIYDTDGQTLAFEELPAGEKVTYPLDTSKGGTVTLNFTAKTGQSTSLTLSSPLTESMPSFHVKVTLLPSGILRAEEK